MDNNKVKINIDNYEVIPHKYNLNIAYDGLNYYMVDVEGKKQQPTFENTIKYFENVLNKKYIDNLYFDLSAFRAPVNHILYIKKEVSDDEKNTIKENLISFLFNFTNNLDISEAKYFLHIMNDPILNSIYDNIKYIDYNIITSSGINNKRLIILIKKIYGYNPFAFNKKKEILINRFFYQSTGTSRNGLSVKDHFFILTGISNSNHLDKIEKQFIIKKNSSRTYSFSFNDSMTYLFDKIFNVKLQDTHYPNSDKYDNNFNYNDLFEVNDNKYMSIGNMYKNIKNEKDRAINIIGDINKYKRFINPLFGAISKFLYHNKEQLKIYYDYNNFIKNRTKLLNLVNTKSYKNDITLHLNDKSLDSEQFSYKILQSIDYKNNTDIFDKYTYDYYGSKSSKMNNLITLLDDGYKTINTILQELKNKHFKDNKSFNNKTISNYNLFINDLFSSNLKLKGKSKISRTLSFRNNSPRTHKLTKQLSFKNTTTNSTNSSSNRTSKPRSRSSNRNNTNNHRSISSNRTSKPRSSSIRTSKARIRSSNRNNTNHHRSISSIRNNTS